MRLLLLCLAVGTPALAQRVDTRVDNIRSIGDGRTACDFHAVPDMRLVHGPARAGAYATWAHRAENGPALLHATFTPGRPRGVEEAIDSITVPVGAIPQHVAQAKLFLDGAESTIPTRVTGMRTANASITPIDGKALAAAMRYTDTLGLVLYDRVGTRLRSYEFQIGDLQDISEIPAIVGWTCRR